MAPLTSTNHSVMEGSGEGRAVQSLSDLCTLSKKVADADILCALNLKCVSSHSSGTSLTYSRECSVTVKLQQVIQ